MAAPVNFDPYMNGTISEQRDEPEPRVEPPALE